MIDHMILLELTIENAASAIKKSRAIIGSKELARTRKDLEAVIKNQKWQ